MIGRMDTFAYWGTELPYFYDLYNLTHLNERQVELAVAKWWLTQHTGRPMLEFGNVLGHYSRRKHTVVDRYEQPAWYQRVIGQTVRNIDVLAEHGTYATIVSISTLEHVGMERDAAAGNHPGPLAALDHLRSLLLPGGSMLVTFPTGVNPVLDGWVAGVAGGGVLGDGDRICTIGRTADGWAQDEQLVWRPYGADSEHPATGEWAEGVVVIEFNL